MKRVPLLLGFCAVLYSCGTNSQTAETSQHTPATISNSFPEKHRPQFHFTPPSGWMNDPNGMVYHEGEYHLFYQHNPDSTVWGPMHWGHAVSKDMVHWEHLPIGLYPDSLGTIFSGSAVVDVHNTSGLGSKENPPLVAIFTYHNAEAERAGRNDFQTQGIAFSVDKGRSWTKYASNPVLPNPGIRDFRDPKVMWHEEQQKWIMALAVADHISFYSSKNLKEWRHESDFGANVGGHGGVWECPDLFKMPVAGTNQEKWVLLVSINPGGPNGGSATQYFVGDFDGSKFVLDQQFAQQLSAKPAVPAGKVFAAFEGKDWGSWVAEGEAFGSAPATGAIESQQEISGFRDKGVVNSFRRGDASTGKLISPAFTIESDYINLLVGGGKHPTGTAVRLLVNNEVVKTATGKNSETLDWVAWDTKALRGQEARIEVIDTETGGWGHVLLDQVMFAAEPAKESKEGIWLDWGRDNYAGVTWSDVPKADGRRLFMGWMSNWAYANLVPTENWRSAMTVARSLSLENTAAGLRLTSQPVNELQAIYGATHNLQAQPVSGVLNISETLSATPATFALNLTLETAGADTEYRLELSNSRGQKVVIGYDAARKEYFINRTAAGAHTFSDDFGGIHWAPRIATGSTHQLQLLVDVASVEFFANGGKTVMTDVLFPDEPFTILTLQASGGQVQLKSGELIELKSIWSAAN